MKSTSIRLPADLKKRLDLACVDRDTTLQLAIINAIDLWLGATPQAPPAPTNMAYSPATAHWHDVLEDVLSRPGEGDTLRMILEKFDLSHRHATRKRLVSGE